MLSPKETVTSIMILFYKDTKAMACSFDGNTDFFDLVAGVLQGDTLAHFQFIICLDYVLQISIDLMEETGFTLKKGKKQISHRNYHGCRLNK